MRLCILSIIIAMAALLCSELISRRFSAKLRG
jgi:molybdate transport system permease protein